MVAGRDQVILLETTRFDAQNHRTLLFTNPLCVLRADEVEDVLPLLIALDRHVKDGFYAAGYIGYESGLAFEQIAPPGRSSTPLAIIGIYPDPMIFDHATGMISGEVGGTAPPRSVTSYSFDRLRLTKSEDEYCDAVRRVQEHIREGDTYQVNLTMKYLFDFSGSGIALYDELKQKQRVGYSAYMRFGTLEIISLSPELFFRRKGSHITVRPMKGTARRGKTNDEDDRISADLSNDTKNRAENVMIVDLLRNDLGKIASEGSVVVDELCMVERYQSLFQMTSTISASLKEGVSYQELFTSLFPSGSVTGAPKIRSMQIIHGLEQDVRGVYTGAIGSVTPNDEALFNVAIRTIVLDQGKGEMGIGSGITAESIAENEWEECLLKARFLTSVREEFDLLETLLWDEEYSFLDAHLRRLADSAYYFEFDLDCESIKRTLIAETNRFTVGAKYKVRLTVSRSGTAQITSDEIATAIPKINQFVAFASSRVDSGNCFLFHKTTLRKTYDDALAQALEEGLEDVIFMNERGEVTEGTIHNIIVRIGSRLMTPPLTCGLLGGVYRQHLLSSRNDITESVIMEKDVRAADAIYICNSVRGMREVTLR